MLSVVRTLAWLACIIYSTIPCFWFLIHPRVDYWRSQRRSPYRILLPVWIGMWIVLAVITWPGRTVTVYKTLWTWLPALLLFCCGMLLYKLAGRGFSPAQLGGLPEILPGQREQRLVTTGIRARIRHPVYLAHLCEMLAWSIGTGLIVCWALTLFALISGAVMIRIEDAELEKRFGAEYIAYRDNVPAVVPRMKSHNVSGKIS